jgi:pilus assembly protein Flp/PilA
MSVGRGDAAKAALKQGRSWRVCWWKRVHRRQTNKSDALIFGDETMKKLVMNLVSDEQGQDLIEYGLLVGIITVGAILSIIAIGPKVADYFADVNALLPAVD